MQRDNEGRRFFGFCGQRVYVPDDPAPGDLARRVLERFRERLAEQLAKEKTSEGDKPANVRGNAGPTAAQEHADEQP